MECNPYFSQEKLIKFCKQRDIVIMAYSPLYAYGGLHSRSNGLNLFQEPILLELAQKYKKSAAQIVLRYLVWPLHFLRIHYTLRFTYVCACKTAIVNNLYYMYYVFLSQFQCGTVPIPKTDKIERLKSNFDIWDFTIAAEDFEKLKSLNKNARCCTFGLWVYSSIVLFSLVYIILS